MRGRLLAGWLTLMGCLSAASAQQPMEGRSVDPSAPAGRAAAVAAAIDRALAEPPARVAVRIAVECSRDGRLPSAVLYGQGFGIWDGRRQFELSPGLFEAALATLRDHRFAELAASYGGKGSGKADAAENGGSAIQVTCRVRFASDELEQEVVQLEHGQQSAELAAIADALYRIVEPASRVGVEAANLEDGLEKLASDALVPEALEVTLHRKPELQAQAAARQGFLLRLSGRRASAQRYSIAGGYGPLRVVDLPAADLAELCRELARRRPSIWPENLWAPDYNDLRISVLDRRAAVQARSFSGMSASTRAEIQREFDAASAQLAALAERVLREGEAVAESEP